MWNDNETNSDLIDYQHHVNAIINIINNDGLLPCSIGIFGDWGSGKSSLMKMISDQFDQDKDNLVIKFNGWLFEGYDDAKTVLMGRIVDEIIKKRTLDEKAKATAIKLLKRIDIIKLGGAALRYGIGLAAAGHIGVGAIASMDMLKNLKDVDYEGYIKDSKDDNEFSLRNNIQGFQRNFEELIAQTKIEKVIVLIDDLDRCNPDTIIGTLEAIKLFLFTKNTAFVIGADERLIKYAVRRRFPEIPGEAAEVGRDYLEKLIQYPIRIPPLNSTELETYINLLFTKLFLGEVEFEKTRQLVMEAKIGDVLGFVLNLKNIDKFIAKENLTDELKEALILSSQVNPVLAIGLNGNPRQYKRFLNTLLIRHEMAKSKGITLSKKILAKLMVLEYFKPETFKVLYELQMNNNGVLKEISSLEQQAKQVTAIANSTDLDALLNDSWIKNWLASEPSLVNENLQPYFYFSRDRLTISGKHLQRMSPAAQDIYQKFIQEAKSVQQTALKECKALSPSDSSAIFEALTERVLQAESSNSQTSNPPLKILVDFTKEKSSELLSQFFIFIEKVPDKNLPLTITTWLEDLTKNTAFNDQIIKLFTKWSKSSANQPLAKICLAKINKK